ILTEQNGPATTTTTITNVTINDPTVGIDVAGGTDTISGGNIFNNTTGIQLRSGGSASIDNVHFSGGPSNTTDVRLASDAGALTSLTGNQFAGTKFYIDNQSAQPVNAISNTF